MAVIDASNHIIGRLASNVAKRLLNGEQIVIVNAEFAIVTGNRLSLVAKYQHDLNRGNVRKGPYFPRAPHLILKRTVRGMLPYQKPRGRTAFKLLRVHPGVPKELQKKTFERVAPAENVTGARNITLGTLSKELGYKANWAV
jgi:large subunit ribosomal protein L13